MPKVIIDDIKGLYQVEGKGLEYQSDQLSIFGTGITATLMSSSQVSTQYLTASRGVLVGKNNTASGLYSIAAGSGSVASGQYSAAFGSGSTASANQSFTFGQSNVSSGQWSLSQGLGNTASGGYTFAHGQTCSATANRSHAEGLSCIASAIMSHAEGNANTAAAIGSHVEGTGNIAVAGASYSHVEGQNNVCSGSYSHVEGIENKLLYAATLGGIHLGGRECTIAGGNYSHVHGVGLVSSGSTAYNGVQYVMGSYNMQGNNTSLFIVGNGGSSASRSDVLRINANPAALQVTGSLWVNGNIQFASGSNTPTGLAKLNGGNPGTVTVSNTLVTANSIIMLTKQTYATAGSVVISAKSANSFTITSTANGDADTVGYFIINPTT